MVRLLSYLLECNAVLKWQFDMQKEWVQKIHLENRMDSKSRFNMDRMYMMS